MKATLHTDGACFGNPGPMGLGISLRLGDGSVVNRSIPFGHGTNNVAEYSALLKGVELAREHGVTELSAFLDSQLVVKQLTGEWRIKDARLREIADAITSLTRSFESFSVEHVPREQNVVADELSKRAAQQV